MNPLMLQAELAQARNTIRALIVDKESYVRLAICLANLIRNKGEAKIVDGHVAIDRADYDDVPKKWQVHLDQREVRPEGAAEETPGEQVIVVLVSAKTPTNGSSILAPSPRIVVPGGPA